MAPEPFKKSEPIETPLVVMVLVALILIVDTVHTVVAEKVKLPDIPKVVPLIVSEEPVVSILKHTAEAIVTVPTPELVSKNTASADVGADAPLTPPDVVDQLVVVVVSHVPVPPTQNLLAID